MTSPLEAAARKRFNVFNQSAFYDFDDLEDEHREIIVDRERQIWLEAIRAAVGCSQCQGTGRVAEMPDREWDEPATIDCPAEHVELTILGETIWADPEKCEWRCNEWFVRFRTLYEGQTYERTLLKEWQAPCLPSKPHAACGWVPRWEAINAE